MSNEGRVVEVLVSCICPHAEARTSSGLGGGVSGLSLSLS